MKVNILKRSRFHYNSRYRELVKIKDGRTILIRKIRPEDKPILNAGFSKLSQKTKYLRFHNSKDQLSPEELNYFTQIDGRNHFALGAVFNGEGVGIIRFYRKQDDEQMAEVAIVIADDFQGKGLGEILLKRIMSSAKERGITRLEFKLLPENEGMRKLIGKVSPWFEEDFVDEELVIHVNIE